jgi:lipopolysaccharide/colanic/teichoic acid biosynthesis glycosyltransferase
MYATVGKRLLDLVVAIPALVLLSPVLGVVAVLILINSGSPIFFRQKRPGFRGRPFILVKFRTMTNEHGAGGELQPDADRLDSLGRFLRATSLDELPELINVIRGNMSLVGPRPLLMQYLDRYTAEQMRRHDVRPGITGWAQVNGRNAITWEERLAQDVWYVDNQTFALDMTILAKTFGKVLSREGINQPGQATMEEFLGHSGTSQGQSSQGNHL